MVTVADVALKVRSKNAGPFWITVDIFCGTPEAYARIVRGLGSEAVAAAFGCPTQTLKRFDIAALDVVKFSLPRPRIQGSREDRDMHGAGWGPLVAELPLAD